MKARKGQITLYIILGLLLLIFISLFLIVLNEGKQPEQPQEITTLPSEVQSVKSYVQECIGHTTQDALELLGRNSGYVNASNLNIRITPSAPESDAVIYQPDLVPYWYYIDQNNKFSSLRPPLYQQSEGDNSIQNQISDYVEQHLKQCTGKFSGFPNLDVRGGSVKAKTEIREQDLLVKVTFPLNIIYKSNQSSTRINQFSKKLDVHLKDIYDFATEIVNAEKKYTFFESLTLNLISVYSALDQEALPPTSSLLLGRKKIVWVRPEVEQVVKHDLLDLLRLVQMQNALNYQPHIVSPEEDNYQLKQGMYNSMNFQLDSHNQYNLTVDFFYPHSPIYFNINDQEVIMPKDRIPSNFFTDMMNLQIQDYSFEYDLSYPIMIRITDPKAFHYQGYTFQLAIESNIRDNRPVNTTMMLTSPSRPARKISIDKPDQLVDQPLTITCTDQRTGEPLENVRVFYKCGQKSFVGTTGQEGTLNASFPYCLTGGKIIYEKEGYLGSAINYNNNPQSSPRRFSIQLYPKKEMQFQVKKRNQSHVNNLDVSNTGPMSPAQRKALLQSQSAEISSQEKAILVINKIKSHPGEQTVPYPNYVIINPEVEASGEMEKMRQRIEQQFDQGQITLEQRNNALQALEEMPEQEQETTNQRDTLELVPGNYTVEAYLLNYQGITIPERTEKVGSWPFRKGVSYPEQNFTVWKSGGGEYNVTITPDQLYSNNQVTLYLFDLGVPHTWEDLANLTTLQDYQQYNYLLRPTFS